MATSTERSNGPGPPTAVPLRRFGASSPAFAGYLRCRGPGEADDVTSEVFVAVFRQLPAFRGDTSAFRSWVFTIAHHRAVDATRSWARVARLDSHDPAADGRVIPSADSLATRRGQATPGACPAQPPPGAARRAGRARTPFRGRIDGRAEMIRHRLLSDLRASGRADDMRLGHALEAVRRDALSGCPAPDRQPARLARWGAAKSRTSTARTPARRTGPARSPWRCLTAVPSRSRPPSPPAERPWPPRSGPSTSQGTRPAGRSSSCTICSRWVGRVRAT